MAVHKRRPVQSMPYKGIFLPSLMVRVRHMTQIHTTISMPMTNQCMYCQLAQSLMCMVTSPDNCILSSTMI